MCDVTMMCWCDKKTNMHIQLNYKHSYLMDMVSVNMVVLCSLQSGGG